MSDRTKLSSGTFLFVVVLLLSYWSAAVSVRAAFWWVVAIAWCAGVWAICLLDTYLGSSFDETMENDAGLVCRRDPISGQLVELTQRLHTTHKHGVHMRRAHSGESWSMQSYFFHVRHGAELTWNKHYEALVRNWHFGKPIGWQARFDASGVRRTTTLWNSDMHPTLVLSRHDPFEHTSTRSYTSTRWAVLVVLPFLRCWRAARILRQILEHTNMAVDVARLASHYAVDLHDVGVPESNATLDQLR